MNKKLNIGVISCSVMAQLHMKAVIDHPNAELYMICDINEALLNETAAKYNISRKTTDYRQMLADPAVDAVIIVTPDQTHREISVAALEAGKHVLCEKPMAVTLAECESMVAAAERNGKHLMIGHNMRFDPVHRRAKQLLDRGVIGDVITFRAVLGNAGPEGWSGDEGTWFFDKNKAALGALSDMGIHKVDLIQYLLGQKVIETTAKVVTLNKRDNEGQLIGVDDNALCILRMSGGALGTMAASWTIYGHECQSTCLYGTKGIMLIYSEPSSPIIVSDMEGNRTSYNLDVPHNGTGVIDEFVDALVHDREPEVSGREALTVMRTIFASINSSNISRTVAVNSDFVTHF